MRGTQTKKTSSSVCGVGGEMKNVIEKFLWWKRSEGCEKECGIETKWSGVLCGVSEPNFEVFPRTLTMEPITKFIFLQLDLVERKKEEKIQGETMCQKKVWTIGSLMNDYKLERKFA